MKGVTDPEGDLCVHIHQECSVPKSTTDTLEAACLYAPEVGGHLFVCVGGGGGDSHWYRGVCGGWGGGGIAAGPLAVTFCRLWALSQTPGCSKLTA